MHLRRQAFDAFGQGLGHFGQPGVLFEQLQELRGVLRRLRLTFTVGDGQGFAVQGVGVVVPSETAPRRR